MNPAWLVKLVFSNTVICLVSAAAAAMAIWNIIQVNDHFMNNKTSTQNLYDGSDDYRYSEYFMFLFTQFSMFGGGMLFAKEGMRTYQIVTVVFLLLSAPMMFGHVTEETKEVRIVYNVCKSIAVLSVTVLSAMNISTNGLLSSPLSASADNNDNYLQYKGWNTAMRGAGLISASLALAYTCQVINKDNLEIDYASTKASHVDFFDILDATRYTLQPFLLLTLLYFGFQEGKEYNEQGNDEKTKKRNKTAAYRVLVAAVVWIGLFIASMFCMTKDPYKDSDFYDVELATGIMYFSFSFLLALMLENDIVVASQNSGGFFLLKNKGGKETGGNTYF